ncbi:hypothetical protein ACX1IE_17960 [Yersinia enterocolitica]
MKELDSFTVERLEELIGFTHGNGIDHANRTEWQALARIALAAKRAEPDWYVVITSVGVWQARYKTRSEAESHIKPWHKDFWIKELYTTPQLNSPEIPEGWKLVPTEITKAMRDAWDSAPNGHEDDDVNMCNAYRAMIAAAPEKP